MPEQMAAFSSRGPASDGRIKPDVVAPGTWVLSGYSDKYQQQYDPSFNPQDGAYQYDGWGFPLNQYYKYMGGTSMSNPLVAGGAARRARFLSEDLAVTCERGTRQSDARELRGRPAGREQRRRRTTTTIRFRTAHEGWGRSI